jgi:hypothetical protein
LLTGQIPLVAPDVHDLDEVIPPYVQEQLPVVRLRAYTLDAVNEAVATAMHRFDQDGEAGVLRRHHFAVENHMFVNRIRTIISSAREIAAHA